MAAFGDHCVHKISANERGCGSFYLIIAGDNNDKIN
jgi:hypothetical protein